MAEGVAAREGGACARGDGSGARGVAVLVHRAREAVGSAEVGGALPVGDHWALGRRDDLSRSQGSRGGEDLGSIPVATVAGRRRLLRPGLRPRVARRDVLESPARRLHRREKIPEEA